MNNNNCYSFVQGLRLDLQAKMLLRQEQWSSKLKGKIEVLNNPLGFSN